MFRIIITEQSHKRKEEFIVNKRNWKIVYNDYTGMQKKAVELVSREMGAQILRDAGIYTIHVLPCEPETDAARTTNTVVIGLYEQSATIRRYIAAEEVKPDGYVVKVMDDPDTPDQKLVLITAHEPCSLFYGAVDFVDDYFPFAADTHGSVRRMDEIFVFPLPDYYHASAPSIKTRSVFTWGHPINDYRDYIENMARLKLNQLIIWNDHVPLNADDVVNYAHEFGISVIWGFAWGWSRHCDRIDLESLDALADDIVRTYEEQYRDIGGDGIYFQSFTELHTDKIGDKLIAEVVTDFVNTVSGKLFQKYPDLLIQFGLHASSVKDHLEHIARVDERVEIMWEDCGTFPYAYEPTVLEESAFHKTCEFTDQILSLRQNGAVSMLFKGFMTLDWTGDRFVHQAGPFVMGMADERLVRHDRELLKPMWRQLQSGWLQHGEYAYTVARQIARHGNPDVTVGLAGQFAGGIWFPEALCAEMLWNCDRPYAALVTTVAKRRCVEMA